MHALFFHAPLLLCVHVHVPCGCTRLLDPRPPSFFQQGVVLPQFISILTGLLLCPLYYWLLVFRAAGGVRGAAIAYSCTMATMGAVDLCVVVWRERVALRGSATKCFHGWYEAWCDGGGVGGGVMVVVWVVVWVVV